MSAPDTASMLHVTCDFCGRSDDYADTAAALDDGWYTHTIVNQTVTWDPDLLGPEITGIAAGYVCPRCVLPPVDKERGPGE